MSDQCEKHRRNGVDLVDPHQLVCPDCDNERLNKRIEELEAKINRGQYMVCEKHPFLTTASPTATALDCPYCKMARVDDAEISSEPQIDNSYTGQIARLKAKLARNNVLRQRIEELQAKLARVEKENKRLIDAHLKNTEQHRPAVTLRDRSDLTHVCVWRQRFEAVQARSEAVLKPLQALEQDDD